MKVKIFAFGIVFLLLLVGCNNEKEFSEILQDERIQLLIHQEKVDNGVVLFYVPNTTGDGEAIEARFIEKTLLGWEASLLHRGGGSSLLAIPTIFLPKMGEKSLLFGFHPNNAIDEIKVEYKHGGVLKEVEANTIENKERHIWFAFVEQPKVKTIYTIKGYFNGELIETVKEESIGISN
ncbi:hypothetical protein BKP35_07050 [Anaerobacillus arseniciselenatis]|uniref:Lipoprotein n=1 Tax=Anaerobacillus arseniciselenatis TaxID=85682 RepID=A0A1S2LP41_9BACI|nr:hypothetical protein [Anaerobacillus arseniciselenatis]OIJ14251.1 hypothetical protein BKP35_07050 [Anaerobacillus arseniciselenatis]